MLECVYLIMYSKVHFKSYVCLSPRLHIHGKRMKRREDKENKIKPTSTTKGSKTFNRQKSKCTNWKKKEPCGSKLDLICTQTKPSTSEPPCILICTQCQWEREGIR